MKITILDDAERDLAAGRRFYESQEPGLGSYFLDSVFADIDSLRLYGKHRMLAKRFPFAVYYRFDGEEARVHAVLDLRQNPSRTRRRLE